MADGKSKGSNGFVGLVDSLVISTHPMVESRYVWLVPMFLVKDSYVLAKCLNGYKWLHEVIGKCFVFQEGNVIRVKLKQQVKYPQVILIPEREAGNFMGQLRHSFAVIVCNGSLNCL